MQKTIFILLMTCFFAVTSAFAGDGHDHGPAPHINQEQAGEKAASIVAKLVQTGKLEGSWAEAKPLEIQQKKSGNNTEWVVTFNNPQAKNKDEQTLYVFLSPVGKYLAANYTGK